MASELKLTGVDELIAELERLPAALRADGHAILQTGAQTARDRIVAAYHVVTGALRAGVRIVEAPAGPYQTRIRLTNTAPYAGYYEFGTSRSRAFPTFLPIAWRESRAALTRVVDRVRAAGLEVTGAPTE